MKIKTNKQKGRNNKRAEIDDIKPQVCFKTENKRQFFERTDDQLAKMIKKTLKSLTNYQLKNLKGEGHHQRDYTH